MLFNRRRNTAYEHMNTLILKAHFSKIVQILAGNFTLGELSYLTFKTEIVLPTNHQIFTQFSIVYRCIFFFNLTYTNVVLKKISGNLVVGNTL